MTSSDIEICAYGDMYDFTELRVVNVLGCIYSEYMKYLYLQEYLYSLLSSSSSGSTVIELRLQTPDSRRQGVQITVISENKTYFTCL